MKDENGRHKLRLVTNEKLNNELVESMEDKAPPPRLRLASDVDLKMAKQGCNRCYGTGIVSYRDIDDPENEGGKISVPVVCRCVSRGGGVKKDQLDRILEESVRKIKDGTFARDMAADIMGLPEEHQGKAVMQLRRRAADPKTPPKTREACFETLRLILN